jgi:CxxC-x17-CxxC domain-containing protein
MGNFKSNQGNKSQGNRSSGSRQGSPRPKGNRFPRKHEERGGFRSYNDRNSRRSPQMHEVVCDKCGKDCSVPFKPTGNKPVLCSDCFKNNDNSNDNFKSPSSSGISIEQFNQLDKKLDRILKVLQDLEIDDEMDEDEDLDNEDDKDLDDEMDEN